MENNPAFRTKHVLVAPSPVLLICRRAISLAFHDATFCRQGFPTPMAEEALAWILDRLDWTLVKRPDGTFPIPPPEIRAELVLSFEACCRWLGEDPDEVRAQGLSRSGVDYANNIKGIPHVLAIRREAHDRWLRSQKQDYQEPRQAVAGCVAIP